eukprot:Platyproteum_vivax@DN16815_c0_g1_i1.p1
MNITHSQMINHIGSLEQTIEDLQNNVKLAEHSIERFVYNEKLLHQEVDNSKESIKELLTVKARQEKELAKFKHAPAKDVVEDMQKTIVQVEKEKSHLAEELRQMKESKDVIRQENAQLTAKCNELDSIMMELRQVQQGTENVVREVSAQADRELAMMHQRCEGLAKELEQSCRTCEQLREALSEKEEVNHQEESKRINAERQAEEIKRQLEELKETSENADELRSELIQKMKQVQDGLDSEQSERKARDALVRQLQIKVEDSVNERNK